MVFLWHTSNFEIISSHRNEISWSDDGHLTHYHSLTLTMCLLDCDCLIISSAFLKGVGVRGVACSREPDTRGVLATLKLITTVLVNIIKQSHKTLYHIDYCH